MDQLNLMKNIKIISNNISLPVFLLLLMDQVSLTRERLVSTKLELCVKGSWQLGRVVYRIMFQGLYGKRSFVSFFIFMYGIG
jgi:hypothetical protein